MARGKARPRADQWARDWYGPRHGDPVESLFDVLNRMLEVPIGPMPRKSGMPPFPSVITEAGVGWVNRAEFMDHAERLLRDGWGIALVVALRIHCALSPSEPMPPWMAVAISNMLFLWITGRSKTLDDVLGVGRSRGQLSRRKRISDIGPGIRADIDAATLSNVAIGDELFEVIASRYSVPVDLVRKVYRDRVAVRRLKRKKN